MALLRYVSHPQVQVDPAVPVPRWSLSAAGRERVERMLIQPWLAAVGRILSSPEAKAVETAELLAHHLDLTVEVRERTGEIDRSATGFVAPERHEALAEACFARPDRSADGWERAIDAQTRIVAALADVLGAPGGEQQPDLVVVGHGGVGTLLYCHLAGLAIDRRHDQRGQGHYWTYDRSSGDVLHPWVPVD